MKKHKPETIEKRTEKAFGKKVYLIGIDVNGDYIWLEEAKFDCGWYWGYGYIETYTNNKHPEKSKDINSHRHFDGCIAAYKHKDGEFIHHPNANPDLMFTTLTRDESWKLGEYMRTAKSLDESARVFHIGGSHVTSCKEESKLIKNDEMGDKINEVMLPHLFKLIDKLLTPVDTDPLPLDNTGTGKTGSIRVQ